MEQAFFSKGTFLFYWIGTILFLFNLWDHSGKSLHILGGPLTKTSLPHRQKWALWLTLIGFLCHTATWVIRVVSSGEIPFVHLREAISFFAWAVVLIFLLIEVRYHVYVLGSFILPLVLLVLISSTFFPHETLEINAGWSDLWLGVHTTLSILGVSGFAIAFISGIMYLLQERFLKSKQLTDLYYKLPSLDLLDQWNRYAILTGFPVLTLGILSGALWAQYHLGLGLIFNHPKQAIAIGTWFFYLLALQGRVTRGWRGRKAAHMAIIGFVGVLFVFVALAYR